MLFCLEKERITFFGTISLVRINYSYPSDLISLSFNQTNLHHSKKIKNHLSLSHVNTFFLYKCIVDETFEAYQSKSNENASRCIMINLLGNKNKISIEFISVSS